MRNKNINIRLTEKEFSMIEKKSNLANMTKTEFLVNACNSKQIVVIDGLQDIAKQLVYLNNNINQLAILAHKGNISIVDLSKFKEGVDRLWQSVSSLSENAQQRTV